MAASTAGRVITRPYAFPGFVHYRRVRGVFGDPLRRRGSSPSVVGLDPATSLTPAPVCGDSPGPAAAIQGNEHERYAANRGGCRDKPTATNPVIAAANAAATAGSARGRPNDQRHSRDPRAVNHATTPNSPCSNATFHGVLERAPREVHVRGRKPAIKTALERAVGARARRLRRRSESFVSSIRDPKFRCAATTIPVPAIFRREAPRGEPKAASSKGCHVVACGGRSLHRSRSNSTSTSRTG